MPGRRTASPSGIPMATSWRSSRLFRPATRTVVMPSVRLLARRWHCCRPGRVDVPHLDQVEQVDPVLGTPGSELHANQCGERNDLELGGPFGFVEFGTWMLVLRAHFFAGEQEVDTGARFALRPIDEDI